MSRRHSTRRPSIGCSNPLCRDTRNRVTEALIMSCQDETRVNRLNEQIRQSNERHQNQIDEANERCRDVVEKCRELEREKEVLDHKLRERGLVIRLLTGWLDGQEPSREDFEIYKRVFDEDMGELLEELCGDEGMEGEEMFE
ncbi:hypothetical protein E2P81_ATG07274 [Venturia nashicola]|uniref:Uncharacterized protein n=1 Tax=Venturia nashicola TaxID=86259 RepID=A0A4Z1PBS1_9PEZI|nr:hypothetical protein E6O75_ATG07434 [Venturia nashicola]TLD31784.1 hypothetical protein E2P81_ATG07274 [Venturia nashicola]